MHGAATQEEDLDGSMAPSASTLIDPSTKIDLT